MQSNQPAITPAQIGAAIVALIAPVAALLAAFHVYTLTASQQGAVRDMILALAGLAAVIVAADAHLRAARNKAHATITSAQPQPQAHANTTYMRAEPPSWTAPPSGPAVAPVPAKPKRPPAKKKA